MKKIIIMENNLYVSSQIVSSMPAMVRNELAKMSAQKQDEFVEEFKRKRKSVGKMYLMWFVFGFHYAYLGKWSIQLLFWFTVGGLWVWYFIDLFRIPSIVNNHNKDIAIDIMRNLKAVSN